MARITLIKGDNAVYVNGEMKPVDLTELPDNFHALQYDDVIGFGVLETKDPTANTPIDAVEYQRHYEHLVNRWHAK